MALRVQPPSNGGRPTVSRTSACRLLGRNSTPAPPPPASSGPGRSRSPDQFSVPEHPEHEFAAISSSGCGFQQEPLAPAGSRQLEHARVGHGGSRRRQPRRFDHFSKQQRRLFVERVDTDAAANAGFDSLEIVQRFRRSRRHSGAAQSRVPTHFVIGVVVVA